MNRIVPRGTLRVGLPARAGAAGCGPRRTSGRVPETGGPGANQRGADARPRLVGRTTPPTGSSQTRADIVGELVITYEVWCCEATAVASCGPPSGPRERSTACAPQRRSSSLGDPRGAVAVTRRQGNGCEAWPKRPGGDAAALPGSYRRPSPMAGYPRFDQHSRDMTRAERSVPAVRSSVGGCAALRAVGNAAHRASGSIAAGQRVLGPLADVGDGCRGRGPTFDP
jgi:hypothetical protein